MEQKVQYSGEFKPVELYPRRADGIAELWLRKNPSTEQDADGNALSTADEAYMELPIADAPTIEEVSGEKFEEWYTKSSKWHPEEPMTLASLEARVRVLEAKLERS